MSDVAPSSYETRALLYRQGRFNGPRWPVDVDMDPQLRYVGMDGPDHLNLGSGVNPIPGAVNVDTQPFPGVNVTFDFTQPWPLDDASYDKVTLFHCLEHVEPTVALRVMQEAHRVLRPGGLAIAEVPDIQGLCAQIVAGNYGMLIGPLYGGHDAPADAHRFGYTASSLALLCHLAGFVRLITKPGSDYHATQMPTIRVEAVKVIRRAL